MLRTFSLILALTLSSPNAINSQQTSAPSQAATVLAQALAALGGATGVSDVTLTGTAERIAGSDDETGTVTYRALPGANRLDLNLSGGTRSEIRNVDSNGPTGTWIGTDGAAHSMAYHNLMLDPGWFPTFTLSNVMSATGSVLDYVGPETKNGISVIHIRCEQQQSSATPSSDSVLRHLTQMDLYLDASTLFPVAFDFDIHPDDNAGFDIPTELRFSDYRNVGSIAVPLHIQKYISNSLFLDLTFQSATLNTGLSSSVFSL